MRKTRSGVSDVIGYKARPLKKCPFLSDHIIFSKARSQVWARLQFKLTDHLKINDSPSPSAPSNLVEPPKDRNGPIVAAILAVMIAMDLCGKHGLSDARYYKWRSKITDMDTSDTKRLKVLEAKNAKPVVKILALSSNNPLKDLKPTERAMDANPV